MESLKMKQAFVEAQLSDDPESPVVRMQVTSDRVDEYAQLYVDMKGEWERLRKRAQAGSVSGKDAERIRKLYRKVIKSTCGAQSYREVVSWLKAGQEIPTSRLNALLSPLVAWITGNVLDLAHPRAVSEAMDGIQPQGDDA